MTVDFLLDKLKTLTTSDDVGWNGVKLDLQALVRTATERCVDKVDVMIKSTARDDDEVTMVWREQVRDEIRRTSPGTGSWRDAEGCAPPTDSNVTPEEAIRRNRGHTSPAKGGG